MNLLLLDKGERRRAEVSLLRRSWYLVCSGAELCAMFAFAIEMIAREPIPAIAIALLGVAAVAIVYKVGLWLGGVK